jgi:1,2-diacylglycerol 3-alpha-glucosyltransferase
MWKIPVVYTLHTMYDDYMHYISSKQMIENILKDLSHKYAKAIGNSVDSIIAPSKKSENYLRKCKVKTKITIVPNSVDLKMFNPEKFPASVHGQIRKKYGFSEEDFVFCFCGRIAKEKNLVYLIEGIRLFADTYPDTKIKLLIIGGGQDLEEYKKLSEKLNLTEIVKFTGKIEHANVPPYYSAADAYISASLSEVYSISLLEAMAMGLPVLVILDPLNVSQVAEGINGYHFNSKEEMCRLMNKLAVMPRDEYKKFVSTTISSVSDLGVTDLARRVLAVYSDIIETFIAKRKDKANKIKNFKNNVKDKIRFVKILDRFK